MTIRTLALGAWLPLSAALAWELAFRAGLLDPLFFPPPSAQLGTAVELTRSGELPRQLGVTMRRMLLGFLIGTSAGLLCGVLMGALGRVRDSLRPSLSGLYTTPKVTLLPVAMLLLGVGDISRILVIAVSAFVIQALHTMDAVSTVSPAYVDVARNYGAGRLKLLSEVYVPASLPHIFTGLRLALGNALLITVAVELVACPDGIGNMIWMAWQTFTPEKLYVGVIASSLLGFLLHHSLERLETRVVPWRRS